MRASTAARAQPVPENRADLAAAIEEREAAAAALKEAKEVLERGEQAIKASTADLERFNDLDSRVAHARAKMMKGGKSGQLPEDLIREREQRRAAVEQLEDNRNALQVLQQEQKEAERLLLEATQAVTFEAYAILLHQAVAASERLREMKQEEWALNDSLNAFEELLSAALLPATRAALLQTMPAQWSRFIESLRMMRPERTAYLANDPVKLASARWRELVAELLEDAEASIE